MYAFLHVSLLEEKAVIQIKQTWHHSTPHKFLYLIPPVKIIVSMVTQLWRFLIRTRINVVQFSMASVDTPVTL